LRGVKANVEVARRRAREAILAVLTEVRSPGSFATWRAERAIGDHDRNTPRLRLDPQGDLTGLDSGMTVWLDR